LSFFRMRRTVRSEAEVLFNRTCKKGYLAVSFFLARNGPKGQSNAHRYAAMRFRIVQLGGKSGFVQ